MALQIKVYNGALKVEVLDNDGGIKSYSQEAALQQTEGANLIIRDTVNEYLVSGSTTTDIYTYSRTVIASASDR